MGPQSCWGLKQEPKALSLSQHHHLDHQTWLQMYQAPQTAWLDCTQRRLELTRMSRAIYRWCLSGGSLLAWWLMARSTEALFVHAEVEVPGPSKHSTQNCSCTMHRAGEESVCYRISHLQEQSLERSPSQSQHFCQGAIQSCICLITFFSFLCWGLNLEPCALQVRHALHPAQHPCLEHCYF